MKHGAFVKGAVDVSANKLNPKENIVKSRSSLMKLKQDHEKPNQRDICNENSTHKNCGESR